MKHATSYAVEGEIACLMQIQIPKGFNSIPLLETNKTAKKKDEFEILLHRETKLKVTDKIVNQMKIGDKDKYIICLFMEALK